MERIRGTSNIGLTDVGKAQIKASAKLLNKLGGLQQLYHSDLKRCVQTANILSDAMTLELINLGSRLDPWHLGKFEGEPVDKVRDQIEYFVYHPDEVVPGVGYAAPGESFNSFKSRFLSLMEILLKRSQTKKIGVVGNYRTLTLMKAWLYAGKKHDFDIVHSAMFDPSVVPGEILFVDPNCSDSCPSTIREDSTDPLKDGLYVIRHGETPWNSPNSATRSGTTGS